MRRALLVLAIGTAATAGACGKFQDPNVVVDLRVIAMTASVPEQVIDVDLKNPPPPSQLLPQLVPSEVCALVADPGFDRRLRWSMTMCPQTSDDRCDTGDPQVVVDSGTIGDPDLAMPEPAMCATVQPDANLIAVVLASLRSDPLHGLQGVQYEVLLRVGGEDADPALDVYAGKALQLAARVPPQRTANTNPSLAELDASVAGGPPAAIALGRCVDQASPLVVAPGTKVRLTPVEPPGVRETYVIPTLDGGYETFTESLTYQWTAAAGKFSDGMTGGPRDTFGNEPPLFTDWTAPKAKDVHGPTDVPIWLVQRDERLGAHWYETCVRVMP